MKRALLRVPQIESLYRRARARQTVARLDLSSPEGLPILVYPSVTAGSSSLTRTLAAIGLDRPVLEVDRMLAGPIAAGASDDGGLAERLGLRLRAAGPGVQIPVVTGICDPIAQLVFEAFRTQPGADPVNRPSVEDAIGQVEREARREDGKLGLERWFDDELKEMFGIDVFALPFAKDRSYAIYRSSQAKVLLLRMEDLDDALGPALAEFLELPEPPKRIRADAPGAEAREVDRVRLPRDVVERIYAQRLPRHFYADATLRAFSDRWAR